MKIKEGSRSHKNTTSFIQLPWWHRNSPGCPADSIEPLGLPRQDRPTNIVTLPVFMRTLRRSSITLTHKSMPGAEYTTTLLGTFRFVLCLLLLAMPCWYLVLACWLLFIVVVGDCRGRGGG